MKRLLIALMLGACLTVSSWTGARAETRAHWVIGFTVHTIRHTNVTVGYRLRCTDGTTTRVDGRRLHLRTPVVRHLQPTLAGATSCSLNVVAWDVAPHVHPHNWPAPIVESWVEVAP